MAALSASNIEQIPNSSETDQQNWQKDKSSILEIENCSFTGEQENDKSSLEIDTNIDSNRSFWTGVWTCMKHDLNKYNMLKLLVSLLIVYSISFVLHSTGSIKIPLTRRRAPKPHRFFPINSPIIDLFEGNDGNPNSLLNSAEAVIIMYYASWSSRSKQLIWHFDQVARTFPRFQLRFIALNCWDPGGQCKQTLKLYSYPLIVAYTKEQALLYTGHHSADYIYRWLEEFLDPLSRLQSKSQVVDFLESYEFTFLCYFNLHFSSNDPMEYSIFRKAAIEALVGDPLRDTVHFAVIITSKLANYYNFTKIGQCRLYLPVGNHNYPISHHFSSEKIRQWINSKLTIDFFVSWIPKTANEGVKSDQLQRLISEGPLLLLLTPKEPLYPNKDDFSMFLQVAREYRFGSELEETAKIPSFLRERRAETIEIAEKRCRKSQPNAHENIAYCQEDLSFPTTTLPSFNSCTVRECEETDYFDEKSSFPPRCPVRKHPPSVHLSAECLKLRLARLLHYRLSANNNANNDTSTADSDSRIFGAYYRYNRTLRFAAIDSNHYRYFVQKWGLSSPSNVILVDYLTEQFFVLDSLPTVPTLRTFVSDFLRRNLERHRLTEEQTDRFLSTTKVQSPTDNEHTLERVTSRQFDDEVVSKCRAGMDIVLFYSGGRAHGPSQALMYVFHTVSAYMNRLKDGIKFMLIDASKNDLSWELTIDRIPAFLFFPAHRPEDSSKFPDSLPPTIPNLLSFVLSQCQSSIRWRLALGLCSAQCLKRNARRAGRQLRTVRTEMRQFRTIFGQRQQWPSVVRRRMTCLRVRYKALRDLVRLIGGLDQTKRAALGGQDPRVRDAVFLEWILKQQVGV